MEKPHDYIKFYEHSRVIKQLYYLKKRIYFFTSVVFFASVVSIHSLHMHTNISNVSTNYFMKPFSKIFRPCEDL